MDKNKCPRCESDNLEIKPLCYDDGTVSDDSKIAKCLDCEFEFIIVYV